MSSFGRRLLTAGIAATIAAGTAAAQLLPPLPVPPVNVPVSNVPVVGPVAGPVVQPVIDEILASPDARQVISPTLDYVGGMPQSVIEAGNATLLELRRLRLRQLIAEHRDQLESDPSGQPVRRGVLIAIDPDPVSLQLAARAGFAIVADVREPELGMRLVTLRLPRGLSARDGLKRLRAAAPRIDADFDHVYEPAGGELLPFAGTLAAASAGPTGRTIGVIDGGVASHPSLSAASIEQRGFAGSPQPTGHGTAVASLIVGSQGAFRGAAPGSALLVADVYGGSRAAGSASVIAKALGWLAAHRPGVINVSLVGPPNRVMERAIAATRSRGIAIVAAVGNDGPAAPPQYPASYAGVVAVTAVDGRGRALTEAGKAKHLDFAAPGADMAAALPGQGYAQVRGTSFAAPLAAARLSIAGSYQRLAAEARPGKGRVGRGIVCGSCRVEPRSVKAK